MKIKFEIYIDTANVYKDHFYKNDLISYCPNDNINTEFCHDELIKHRLIEFTNINYSDGDSIDCFLDLTEEEVLYLLLKYDNFNRFISKYGNNNA